MLIVVSFKVDPELLEKLDAYAMKRGLSRSEVIRLAISILVEGDNVTPIRIEKPFSFRRWSK